MFFQTTGDTCCPDWLVSCQNFECSGALNDAIITSLFTEARDASCDQGGWWAQPSKGSRLHTITTTNISQAMALAEGFADDALQWLVSDGVITDLRVSSEYEQGGSIRLCVSYAQPEQCNLFVSGINSNFGWVWQVDNN